MASAQPTPPSGLSPTHVHVQPQSTTLAHVSNCFQGIKGPQNSSPRGGNDQERHSTLMQKCRERGCASKKQPRAWLLEPSSELSACLTWVLSTSQGTTVPFNLQVRTLRFRGVKKPAPKLKLQRWNPNLALPGGLAPKLILFQKMLMPYWKIK